MFGFIGFLVVVYFGWKILRYFLFPVGSLERAERRYLENPTNTNYKLMVAARIRLERLQNK